MLLFCFRCSARWWWRQHWSGRISSSHAQGQCFVVFFSSRTDFFSVVIFRNALSRWPCTQIRKKIFPFWLRSLFTLRQPHRPFPTLLLFCLNSGQVFRSSASTATGRQWDEVVTSLNILRPRDVTRMCRHYSLELEWNCFVVERKIFAQSHFVASFQVDAIFFVLTLGWKMCLSRDADVFCLAVVATATFLGPCFCTAALMSLGTSDCDTIGCKLTFFSLFFPALFFISDSWILCWTSLKCFTHDDIHLKSCFL